ncbi:siderophore biosynthesis protein, partial [Rhizobium leguminosarum]
MEFDAVKKRSYLQTRSYYSHAPNLIHLKTAYGHHEAAIEVEVGIASVTYYHGDTVQSSELLMAAA